MPTNTHSGRTVPRTGPASLRELYVGPLAEAVPPRVGPPPGEAWRGDALLAPGTLAALLDRFAREYSGDDRRAVASQWSKWHFGAVLLPVLTANLLADRALPAALGELHLLLAPSGAVNQLVLGHDGATLPGVLPYHRFETLLEQHLLPLFDALARVSGASPRVFASNAGNVFEYCLGVLDAHPAAKPGATEPARRLLAMKRFPDGRRNPLYEPVHYQRMHDGSAARIRRLCCIRYLLPELGYCENCPLTATAPAD